VRYRRDVGYYFHERKSSRVNSADEAKIDRFACVSRVGANAWRAMKHALNVVFESVKLHPVKNRFSRADIRTDLRLASRFRILTVIGIAFGNEKERIRRSEAIVVIVAPHSCNRVAHERVR